MDCDKTIGELQNLEAIAFGYSENGEVFGVDCSDFEQIMTDTADLIRELLERLREAVTRQKEYEQFMERWQEAVKIAGAVKDIGAERIAEMVQADREGRCVVLPCKAGDTFYRGDEKYKADHWNVVLTSIFWVGERKNITLLYPEEVGKVLEEMEDK